MSPIRGVESQPKQIKHNSCYGNSTSNRIRIFKHDVNSPSKPRTESNKLEFQNMLSFDEGFRNSDEFNNS